MDIADRIRARFEAHGGVVSIPLQKGDPFMARLTPTGIEVSNLGTQPFLPWAVFEETVKLPESQGGRAKKGDCMGPKLGSERLPLDSVEGQIAAIVYGKKTGDSVFRRVTPTAAILEWAGICENGRGYLKLRSQNCQVHLAS
jgi:hypothetical protein